MMSTLFYRNRHLLILSLLVILVSGLSSFYTLPRLEDPWIVTRFATILSRYPGATAERVEALVTEKIENQLTEISEIRILESSSRTGISLIVVELEDWIPDPEPFWSKIRNRLTQIQTQLPQGVQIQFDDKRTVAVANALVLGLTWESEQEPAPLNIMNRLAQELAKRLRHINGTEFVQVYGEASEEISIQISAQELASLGRSSAEIAHLVQQADAKVSAGYLRNKQHDIILEVQGEVNSLARLAEIPLEESDSQDILRLREIASIQKSHQTPLRQWAMAEGKPALFIAARVEENMKSDVWKEKAQKKLKEFQAEIPCGMQLRILFDQNTYTQNRLETLQNNLFLSTLIVLGIIFLMMGFKASLFVGLALPLCSCCVFAGLNFLGVPIHQMSVTGLIMALGLLIDNAIIAVDDLRYRLKSGESSLNALQQSIHFLFFPLLSSSLTTVIAFMPILLLEGAIGEFTRSIAISVILAIVFSFLISMTLIPALTCIFYRKSTEKSGFWENGFQSRWLLSLFRFSLKKSIGFPLLGIALSLFFPLWGFLKIPELRDQFFPPADRDQVYLQLFLQPGLSLEHTQSRVQALDRFLRSFPEIRSSFWSVGQSAPVVYYNMLSFQDEVSHFAEGVVHVQHFEQVPELLPRLQKALDQNFPDIQVILRAFGQGPPVEAPIEIRIYGSQLKQLQEIGEELRTLLNQREEVLHTGATLKSAKPKIFIQVDEDQARLFGLSLTEVAQQLEENFEGIVGGSLLEETEELPIRIRFSEEERQKLEDLYSFNFVAPHLRTWVPFHAIGQASLLPEFYEIPHRSGQRVNSIRAYLQYGALPQEVLKKLIKSIHALELPSGYSLEIGGESEEQKDALGKLFAYVAPLSILMVATIVLSFRSFILAGFIGLVAFLALGLAAFSTWYADLPFGFMSFLGTAGLIGVCINDSIVILAGIRENLRAREGDLEAIIEEVLKASRHVLSTTFTTVGGFIPLILTKGGFWPPLAVVIAGGVTGATIIALYFIPALYYLLSPYLRSRIPSTIAPSQENR
jgi:multidrug efflux pump